MMNNYITKYDSKALYGIAVLLMIFHHCFCIPSRLGYNYIPIFGDYVTEARVAYFGRLCIAIYAFITGYGLAIKSKRIRTSSLLGRLKADCLISFKQLINFYKKFWVVFLIFVPIGIAFFNAPYDPMSLIKGIFLGEGYNAEWWYVTQYIKFLLIFPLLEVFIYFLNDKKSWKYVVGIIVISIAFIFLFGKVLQVTIVKKAVLYLWYTPISVYSKIFCVAFLISYFKIFEKINETIPNNILSTIIAGGGILALIIIRWLYVKDPAQNSCDVYITPFFIYFLVKLLNTSFVKQNIYQYLLYIGKYSTYIWLVHTFWVYYYFQNIILFPRYSVLIYIWTVIISILNAVLIEKIQDAICRMVGHFTEGNKLKSRSE